MSTAENPACGGSGSGPGEEAHDGDSELGHSQPVVARRPHPWGQAKATQALAPGGGPTVNTLTELELDGVPVKGYPQAGPVFPEVEKSQETATI